MYNVKVILDIFQKHFYTMENEHSSLSSMNM